MLFFKTKFRWMKRFLFLGAFFAFLLWAAFSCQNAKPSASSEVVMAAGKTILENQCYSCHSPNAAHGERLAPPMAAVKKHYRKKYPLREDFVEALLAFTLEPQKDKALMKGAVEKFGLMPKAGFAEADLRKAAHYIYQAELPAPPGFGQKHAGKKGSGGHGGRGASAQAQKDTLAQGKALAMRTKKALGKNLMEALATGGPEYALDFCHLQALAITDSMSEVLNARISRVSDKPRNPANRASVEEGAIMAQYRAAMREGKGLRPVLEKLGGGKLRAYFPIETNQMCLQCHGQKGKTLAPETAAKIAQLYPQDQATGYSANQLRGLFKVEWEPDLNP